MADRTADEHYRVTPDQFKSIRIGGNLLANYNKQLDYELEGSVA